VIQVIVACAEAFRGDEELVATGIGVIPRIAASLAMKTFSPELLMTDSEAWMLSEPNPLGDRGAGFKQQNESWIGYARFFDNLWTGKRHAMLGPTQIDRFGQSNTSALGGTYQKPKVMMLGARGFPGNSISHPNSFFVPAHSSRIFVEGECDFVSSVGYNPDRLAKGYSLDDIDIRRIVTNLCVMDFGGAKHAARLVSLHPGVTIDEVVENTGFELIVGGDIPQTPAPSSEQLQLIAEIDPHDMRAKQIKDNPAGVRA